MIKKTICAMMLLGAFGLKAQENQQKLQSQLKVNAGFQGIDLGFEVPLSRTFVLDASTGFGGYHILNNGENTYALGNTYGLSYFAKLEGKYYISRERRARKGHDLQCNSGSFFAIQTKYNSNNATEGSTMLTEVHFGQQLAISNNFLFAYHAGIGRITNLGYSYDAQMMPTLGVKLTYVIKSFK